VLKFHFGRACFQGGEASASFCEKVELEEKERR